MVEEDAVKNIDLSMKLKEEFEIGETKMIPYVFDAFDGRKEEYVQEDANVKNSLQLQEHQKVYENSMILDNAIKDEDDTYIEEDKTTEDEYLDKLKKEIFSNTSDEEFIAMSKKTLERFSDPGCSIKNNDSISDKKLKSITLCSQGPLNVHLHKQKEIKPNNCDTQSFNCDICGHTFAKKQTLNRHVRIHTGERPYKCLLCPASFSQNYSLKNHNRTHTKERPFKCDICGHTSATKNSLACHVRTHTGERPYKCSYCSKTYTNNTTLRRHQRTHTEESPFNCDICGHTFTTKNSLACHVRTHTGERPYKCSYCSKAYTNNTTLRRHQRTHNTCDICGKSFAIKCDLEKHKVEVHNTIDTDPKRYKCGFCELSFYEKYRLNRHTRIHTGERPYKCSYCPKAFVDNSAFRYHERIHTKVRPYRCDFCGLAFAKKNLLVVHVRTHTGERPFKCSYCPKAFFRSSTFRTHERNHRNELPYRCDVCGLTFEKKRGLDCHVRKHTGERPFKCKYCSASFAAQHTLKRHHRTHTSEPQFGDQKDESIEENREITNVAKIEVSKSTGSMTEEKNAVKLKKKFEIDETKMITSAFDAFDEEVEEFIQEDGNEKGSVQLQDNQYVPQPKKSSSEMSIIPANTSGKESKSSGTQLNERRFTCDICRRTFKRNDTLIIHVRTHSAVRPYKCLYCPATFTTKYNLQNHYRTHTNERPYKCDFCPKAFAVSGNRNIHQRTHSKERLTCDVCDKSFLFICRLKKHKEKVHNTIDIDSSIKT